MIDQPVCIAYAHDGDTITLCSGEKVRMKGIDAPETRGSPRCSGRRRRQLAYSRNPAWCDFALGQRAQVALTRILARGPATIHRYGTDSYGRTLATLTVDGRDVGQVLIAYHLARLWR